MYRGQIYVDQGEKKREMERILQISAKIISLQSCLLFISFMSIMNDYIMPILCTDVMSGAYMLILKTPRRQNMFLCMPTAFQV